MRMPWGAGIVSWMLCTAVALASDHSAQNLLEKAYSALTAGRYQEAIDLSDDALKAGPLTDDIAVEALRRKGSAELRRGNYGEAVAHFSSALQFRPRDVGSLFQRCWAYTKLSLYTPAVLDCERAEALVSARPSLADLQVSVFVTYADLLRRLGRPEKAVEVLSRALSDRDHSRSWELMVQLAFSRVDMGDIDGAKQTISELLDDKRVPDSERATLINLRGDIHLSEGGFGKAREEYKEALKYAPSNSMYQYNVCTALILDRKWKLARESCSDAVALSPKNATYLDAAGLSNLFVGDYENAVKLYERAHRLDPSNTYIHATYLAALKLSGWREQYEKLLTKAPPEAKKLAAEIASDISN